MIIFSKINFQENSFSVRTLSRTEELLQAYRLRHEVYCDTLRWVKPNLEGLDIERYDDGSVSLAAFGDEGRLLGLARTLTTEHPFVF